LERKSLQRQVAVANSSSALKEVKVREAKLEQEAAQVEADRLHVEKQRRMLDSQKRLKEANDDYKKKCAALQATVKQLQDELFLAEDQETQHLDQIDDIKNAANTTVLASWGRKGKVYPATARFAIMKLLGAGIDASKVPKALHEGMQLQRQLENPGVSASVLAQTATALIGTTTVEKAREAMLGFSVLLAGCQLIAAGSYFLVHDQTGKRQRNYQASVAVTDTAVPKLITVGVNTVPDKTSATGADAVHQQRVKALRSVFRLKSWIQDVVNPKNLQAGLQDIQLPEKYFSRYNSYDEYAEGENGTKYLKASISDNAQGAMRQSRITLEQQGVDEAPSVGCHNHLRGLFEKRSVQGEDNHEEKNPALVSGEGFKRRFNNKVNGFMYELYKEFFSRVGCYELGSGHDFMLFLQDPENGHVVSSELVFRYVGSRFDVHYENVLWLLTMWPACRDFLTKMSTRNKLQVAILNNLNTPWYLAVVMARGFFWFQFYFVMRVLVCSRDLGLKITDLWWVYKAAFEFCRKGAQGDLSILDLAFRVFVPEKQETKVVLEEIITTYRTRHQESIACLERNWEKIGVDDREQVEPILKDVITAKFTGLEGGDEFKDLKKLCMDYLPAIEQKQTKQQQNDNLPPVKVGGRFYDCSDEQKEKYQHLPFVSDTAETKFALLTHNVEKKTNMGAMAIEATTLWQCNKTEEFAQEVLDNGRLLHNAVDFVWHRLAKTNKKEVDYKSDKVAYQEESSAIEIARREYSKKQKEQEAAKRVEKEAAVAEIGLLRSTEVETKMNEITGKGRKTDFLWLQCARLKALGVLFFCLEQTGRSTDRGRREEEVDEVEVEREREKTERERERGGGGGGGGRNPGQQHSHITPQCGEKIKKKDFHQPADMMKKLIEVLKKVEDGEIKLEETGNLSLESAFGTAGGVAPLKSVQKRLEAAKAKQAANIVAEQVRLQVEQKEAADQKAQKAERKEQKAEERISAKSDKVKKNKDEKARKKQEKTQTEYLAELAAVEKRLKEKDKDKWVKCDLCGQWRNVKQGAHTSKKFECSAIPCSAPCTYCENKEKHDLLDECDCPASAEQNKKKRKTRR
jgi:hypothetical protein